MTSDAVDHQGLVDDTTDHLVWAKNLMERLGGFNGNGIDELGPAATACALIAIADELTAIRVLLTEPQEKRP